MKSDSIEQYAQSAIQTTRRLIEMFGGRLAGSEACFKTAERLCEDLTSAGAQARLESFEAHPAAFTGFYRIDVLIYLIALGLLWLGRPVPAALVRDGLVYHTMQDTVEAIEPQAVEACLAVACEWVREKSNAGQKQNTRLTETA